jgi:hypothetical protein
VEWANHIQVRVQWLLRSPQHVLRGLRYRDRVPL